MRTYSSLLRDILKKEFLPEIGWIIGEYIESFLNKKIFTGKLPQCLIKENYIMIGFYGEQLIFSNGKCIAIFCLSELQSKNPHFIQYELEKENKSNGFWNVVPNYIPLPSVCVDYFRNDNLAVLSCTEHHGLVETESEIMLYAIEPFKIIMWKKKQIGTRKQRKSACFLANGNEICIVDDDNNKFLQGNLYTFSAPLASRKQYQTIEFFRYTQTALPMESTLEYKNTFFMFYRMHKSVYLGDPFMTQQVNNITLWKKNVTAIFRNQRYVCLQRSNGKMEFYI